jgi:tRNA nucleotidyltransferase (CCA-adding enzyme)
VDPIVKEINELLGSKLELYQVGGSVRDAIMNRKPKDYDFATPQSPEEIEKAIRDAGRRPYRAGKRFGTFGVKINGNLVEITAFKNEAKTIQEDLSYRDFTINAIAMDMNGRYIDPYNGRLDIMSGIIRCVGSPKKRFGEDPLRMVRVARFASELGFNVDQYTKSYMKKMAHTVLKSAKERWVSEMDKILVSPDPVTGLQLLMETRLINFMIPELALQYNYDQNSPYHDFTLWEHTLKVVSKVDNDINLRWGALLHDVGKPFVATLNKKGYTNYIHHAELGYEIVLKLGAYLKWSKERTDTVSRLVLHHMDENSPLKKADDASKKKETIEEER